jgi:phosphatidylserine/phosphatidylglycerophosphate/cardiolipin synthase-like enzyme/predicted extracellular nuclease
MRHLPRLSSALASLAILASLMVAVPQARAVATHVVISELTTGWASGTDEFVELYNPTSSAISLSGWKMQYSSATNGATYTDKTTLSAGASIPAHGFFLLAASLGQYTGTTTPDATFPSGLAAVGGHVRFIDASAVEVDRVGWGTAVAPEGGGGFAAPAPTTTASIERKASAGSTAASLATGGAEEFAGNGQDTNVNSSDFVLQTSGRKPQNTTNPPEPAFSAGGNGTGRGSATPATVFTEHAVPSLAFSVAQDSAYTLTDLAILIPSDWTWSHTLADVALSGTAFASATPSIVGDTIFVAGAAVTTADSGLVTVSNLTAPATTGTWTFTLRSAVAAGTLSQVVRQPTVRVLKLVPIVSVHVNDAAGVPTSPFGVGSEVTITGTVTVNWSATNTSFYLQDGTAGINCFSYGAAPVTLQAGDSIIVTGSILQYRGLTEVQPDYSMLQVLATGRPAPEPLVLTCADVNATFHSDGTEPNEGRLIRINGVSYNSVTSTITDASGTTDIYIPGSYPPTPSVFDVIGILSQYKPGSPAPGPPYLADYEISPRTPDDIIAHPGPVILTTPYEDHIQPTSVQVHWTTDVASTSIVRYGLTAALGDSVVDSNPVTTHDVTIPGLTPATVYHYSVGSGDVNGSNFSTTGMFCTASPAQVTGEINAYFNQSVNTSLAWLHPANGNQDLPARLVTRINNAKRSIDGAIYSMSGTVGTTIANALVSAKNRGLKVRVICEADNRNTLGFNTVAAGGIPLIDDKFDPINYGAGLMHNKFLVFDARDGAPESTWVWTGSWNLTDPGTNADYQNAIEIQDQSLAVVYTLEFNEMWGSSTDVPNASNSRFGARKLDDTPHKFVIGGRAASCYFSPSDGANWQIISTINAAQHSVGFELLTLTRSDIANALIAKKTAGLKVRGDLDNGTDSGSEYANLVAAGVDVRLKTGSGLLHHKYCLVDADNPTWDGVTLTGSHNWSSSAENSNNENTFILHDPDIANQYLQEFAARYYQYGGTDTVRVTDVAQIDLSVPRAVMLAQNYPNPFRGSTSIVYAIPVAQQVSLRMYDLQGREVQKLVDQPQAAGKYRVDFSVKGLASGVYFCRLQVGKVVQQRKMLLLQ